jgi:hypothetical protein
MHADVKRRFKDHMRNNNGNKIKTAWINELKSLGLSPVLVVLEENLKEPECFAREAYWITHYIELGAPLTSTRCTKKTEGYALSVRYVFTQRHYDYEISLGRRAVLLSWY